MSYERNDVILYQIMDCLVEDYGYSIIRFQGQKQDLWLTNKDNPKYPVIRLNPATSTSLIFEQDYLERVTMFMRRLLQSDEKILIINTNEASTEFEEHNFQQILFHDEKESSMLFATFPHLQYAVKKVDNNDSEIRRINQSLRNFQMKKTRANTVRQIPKFTLGIMGVCIAVFLLTQLLAMQLGGDAWTKALLIAGAYYKTFVVAAHEYWRFITAGFHHLSISHLLMNMLALYSLGSVVEKSFNKKQYVAILLVSIICGNLLVFVVENNQISAGISGGLYGLMASVIVIAIENQTFRIPQVRSSLLRVVWINLLISLLPGVSFTAHMGGFVAGAIMSFLFVKNAKWKFLKPHVAICFVILIGGLSFYGLNNNTVKPLYPTTDYQVIKDVRKLGLDGYANYLEKNVDRLYGE